MPEGWHLHVRRRENLKLAIVEDKKDDLFMYL
jgi:hypothetical protein